MSKGLAMTNSTVKPNAIVSPAPLKSDEKLLPRYLRRSSGSCHDFCKYGLKHVDDAMKRNPTFPRFLGNNQMPDGEYTGSNFMTLRQRRQKSELKAMITCTENELADKIKVIEQIELPPEKIIRVPNSPTSLAEGSAHECSSLKHNAALDDQTNNASHEHAVANQDDKYFEGYSDIPSHDHESAYPSDFATEEHVPITLVGGSSEDPVTIKFIISPADYKDVDPSQGLLMEEKSIELITASPITDHIVSAQRQTANGAEQSYDEPIRIRRNNLPRSSEGLPTLELKNQKSKAFVKCRPVNRVEIASKESFGMKLKHPSTQKSTSSTINKPTDRAGFSKVQIHVKSLSIGDKIQREMNKLKSGSEATEVSDRYKHLKKEQDDLSVGPKFAKKNFALRKTMKSVRMVAEQESPSCVKSTIASVTSRVPKKGTLSSSKKICASTSLKLCKHSAKSSSPSISSTRISGTRNHEKIIKVSNKLNAARMEVFEPLSKPPFTESQITKVSNMKLRKCTSFTVNNQTKAGKFRVSEKILNATELNPENVDLKTSKQELRKYKSFPNRKEEHEKSGSKLSGGNEPILHREAIQRTNREVGKFEIKTETGRNTSVNSEDKIKTPPKLNFSRGMIVDHHSENNNPVRLRFKPLEMVGHNQNAKIMQTKSFKNWMESDAAESNTSPLEAVDIVLRRLNVHDKKETKNLFNDVIEETASKLVGARKSRVRALVGAFETVISLQEN